MQVREIMRKNVITVTQDMTLREVAKLFIENKISGAPVVDRKGKLEGVISQTDIVRRDREAPIEAEVPEFYSSVDRPVELKRGYHVETPDFTRVRDVMTPIVLGADETTSISEVVKFMLSKHIHRVVITRDGHLAGIVTTMDMLRAMLEIQEPRKFVGTKK